MRKQPSTQNLNFHSTGGSGSAQRQLPDPATFNPKAQQQVSKVGPYQLAPSASTNTLASTAQIKSQKKSNGPVPHSGTGLTTANKSPNSTPGQSPMVISAATQVPKQPQRNVLSNQNLNLQGRASSTSSKVSSRKSNEKEKSSGKTGNSYGRSSQQKKRSPQASRTKQGGRAYEDNGLQANTYGQSQVNLGSNEADEFSFVCEHIEDEPSIHVRTISQFQNIMGVMQKTASPYMPIQAKKPLSRELVAQELKPRATPYQTSSFASTQQSTQPVAQAVSRVINANLVANKNSNNVVPTYYTQSHSSTSNYPLQHHTSASHNVPSSQSNHVQSTNMANQSVLQQSRLLVSMLSAGDDTCMEPSGFFDEHNCSTSVLHRCQLIERYQIPLIGSAQSKEQQQTTAKLNNLINKVKQDITQSMSINQSEARVTSCSQRRLVQQPPPNVIELNMLTDMTNDSGFPNITNEELHITVSKNFDETTSHWQPGPATNPNNTVSIQNQTGQLPQSTDNGNSELHKLHLLQTLQSLQYMKQVTMPKEHELAKKSVYLDPPKNPSIKKTIIFDMDETLIHCVDDIENEDPDAVLSITFPNGEIIEAGINVRPYAIECLREANKQYQVGVFTASHKFYADEVLDYLDPDHELIHFRMYRDNCIQTPDGVYIKDLRIIKNRCLKDIVIVDNAVYSFGFQLDNGIPIIPFYNNRDDEELLHLVNYINCLSYFEDIREQNARAFQLRELESADLTEYLEYFFGGNANANKDPNAQPSEVSGANHSQGNCFGEGSSGGVTQFYPEDEDQSAIQEEEAEDESDNDNSKLKDDLHTQRPPSSTGTQKNRDHQTQAQPKPADVSDNQIQRTQKTESEIDQREIMALKKKLDFETTDYVSQGVSVCSQRETSDQKNSMTHGGGDSELFHRMLLGDNN